MKKFLWWLAINGGFAAAVWFGVVGGVEGALHVAKFWVFAVAVPMGLLGLTDALQKWLAAAPQHRPAQHAAQRVIGWFALGAFVWGGHVVTAVAWAFWMLASAICREGVKKLRAGRGESEGQTSVLMPEPTGQPSE